MTAASLHGLVEDQTRLRPTAPAIDCPIGGVLDYAELDRRAERVAAALYERGARHGDLVGLCLERSADAVAALLGVLKAGAAYLPLDPSYPPERIDFMARDARPRLVVVGGAAEEELVGGAAATLRLEEATAGGGERPARPVDGDDVAYVIYTSGSTGEPKGVLVPHAGIRNRLLWEFDRFPLGEGDAVMQRTSWSFDISVWEIFMPLARGARLVLADPARQSDPAYVVGLTAAKAVTEIALVPSLLQALLDEEPGLSSCPALRHVFCGGEVLTAALQRRFFATVDAGLHNFYGPTEYSIDATCWSCRPDDPRATVPIGHAIANTRLYVLDDDMRPVADGATGELFLAGAGLANGYLDRPALTAERFLPDPFADEPGARMYRTGDRVRRLEDGSLDYLGRLDDQVKVRGYRVELGEVEAALVRLREVAHAAAAVVSWRGEDELGAWVVPADAVTPAALRRELADRLPAHMVPTTFTLLERLPVGPQGKVARGELPAPTEADLPRNGRGEEDGTADPRIVDAFASVLAAEEVGPHESFFELGGTSMQAVRLAARLSDALGRDVPLELLFDAPTPADLERELC